MPQDENISPDDFGTDFELSDVDEREYFQMTFVLHAKQKELIDAALRDVDMSGVDTYGNANKNGNALYAVIKAWAEQKRLH